jgi:hypothetical protein
MPSNVSSKGKGKGSSKTPPRSVDLCAAYVRNTAWKVATDNGIEPQQLLSSAAMVSTTSVASVTHTVSAPEFQKLHLPEMESIDVYVALRPLPQK